jgi:hypothetical protein
VSVVPSLAPGSPARHELIKERALEDKVLEAWSLAQADPTRVERVAVFIRKAARVFPRNSRIRFLSACLLELEGRPDEALAELERLLRSDPEHEDAARELRRLRGSLAPQSVGDRLKRLFGKGG